MSSIRSKVPLTTSKLNPGERFVSVIFDFSPSVPEELEIQQGDVLKVLNKIDEFWLRGLKLHNGNTGQFPQDFVKDITIPRCSEDETLLYALDTFYPEADEDLSFEKGDIIILEKKINNEWGSGRCNFKHGMFPLNYTERLLPLTISSLENQMKTKTSNTVKSSAAVAAKTEEGLGVAKATMSLTAQLEEELSFCAGDEIIITEVLEDGAWYKGKLGSDVGSFPASFVKLLAPLKKTPEKHPPLKVPLNRTGSKDWKMDPGLVAKNATNNNNVLSPSLNEVDTKETTHALTLSEYRYAEDVLPNSVTGAPSQKGNITEVSNTNKVLYTVTALHNFTGNTEREMSFEKGIRIPVIEEVDEHWLIGKIGDSEGYVPRAYVSSGDKEASTEASGKEAPKSLSNKNMERNGHLPDAQKDTNTQNHKNYVKITGSELVNRTHVYSTPQCGASIANTDETIKERDFDLKKAVALYDYEASNKFDLSITSGETLWVFREVDENWCEVKNEDGNKGIIPFSYIRFSTPVSAPSGEYMTVDEHRRMAIDVESETDKKIGNNYVSNALKKDPHPNFNPPTTYSNAHMNSSTMPVLFEQADWNSSSEDKARSKVRRQFAFSTPRPFSVDRAYRPVGSNVTDKKGGRNEKKGVLMKSISVDSSRHDGPPSHAINRSRSIPNSDYRSHGSSVDSRARLNEWKSNRMGIKHNDQPSTPPNERAVNPLNNSENIYETPIPASSRFNRATSRSASMREIKSPGYFDYNPSNENNSNFVKIKSDSDLSVEAVRDKLRPRSATTRRKEITSTRHGVMMRIGNRDSVSTTSTESGSSFGDPKGSHSSQSDTSESLRMTSNNSKPLSGTRSPHRPVPPIPPRSAAENSSPVCTTQESLESTYPPSPWSPPVPKRNQSLHHDAKKVEKDVSGDTAQSPSRTSARRTGPPVRPAPKLPSHRTSNKDNSMAKSEPTSMISNPPEKKVAPMRPANPPMAAPTNGRKMRAISSRETKEKIERLRSEIEEYSRMKRDLELLYQGTLDGKERREISENKEFVKANLRRLQKEFHDTIAEQDHIYESIEMHIKPLPRLIDNTDSVTSSLPAPTLPREPESPGTMRRKRREKRLLVVTELVNSERDFVTDVTVTVEDIMNELENRMVPLQTPQATINSLFGNMRQIKEFAEGLLKEFEQTLENEYSAENDPEGLTIGQVFIDNIPEMKEVYMTYCRNHDDGIAMLEKCESDPEFMQVVGECLEVVKSKVNVFDLGSFLIKPVQRILKYPLLIGELIKLTDRAPPNTPDTSDLDKLVLAAKMMQAVANDINEDKRTKDLVRKYKNASSEGLSEKLGKISIKSLKKKSTRISRRIGHVTGITAQGTRDVQFDEIEKRFKTLERALKMFISNVTTYGDRCRDVLLAEMHVSKAIVDVVYMPDRTHPVAQYHSVAEKMSGQLYRQFHDQVQLRALSPISSLLVSFKSPQTIIDKRYDKLLDYERLQKNSDSKEKTQAAKHDYEALNNSLIDELPKLCDLGLKLLTSCTAIFAQVHKDFEQKLLDAMNPLLVTIQQADNGSSRIPSNHEIEDRFNPCHAEAVSDISRLQIVPASFGALFGSNKAAETGRRTRTSSGVRTTLESPKPQRQQQSAQVRQGILQKYARVLLHVACHTYSASQLMDISCNEGDLLAVLKQQDPMGSKNRWFVDTGVSTGFLPAALLKPYDPSSDETCVKIPLGNSSSSITSNKTPIPAPRSKSPTPSSRSISSGDSSSTSGASKAPLSPFALRETLSAINKGTLAKQEPFSQFQEEDIMQAFAEEDEIFNDMEYEPLPPKSPNSTKQHFRTQFEFTARSNLELTVCTGDIVKLIMAHDTDGNSEWWLVSNAEGKQGYVPSNYLSKAEYL